MGFSLERVCLQMRAIHSENVDQKHFRNKPVFNWLRLNRDKLYLQYLYDDQKVENKVQLKGFVIPRLQIKSLNHCMFDDLPTYINLWFILSEAYEGPYQEGLNPVFLLVVLLPFIDTWSPWDLAKFLCIHVM